MNAAEILFEAYDALPVPDEREFLELVFARANEGLLTSLLEDVLTVDEMATVAKDWGSSSTGCQKCKERDIAAAKRKAKKESGARRKENIERWKQCVAHSPYPWQVEDAKEALKSEGIEV